MRAVDPGKSFDSWREAARPLLAAAIPPEEILWENDALFPADPLPPNGKNFPVPPGFIALAKAVSCHADARRWAVLYRLLWRLTRGGEGHLLEIASDPDIVLAHRFAKNVRREIHKMHAFVRFRKVADEPECYAAWFEPEHHIVQAAAPFFRKRFANMCWSILTPHGCAHWNRETLEFSPGITRDPHEKGDPLEDAWKVYYRSIFNPARLKMKMMKSEMAERYWKNLPEAPLIPILARQSGQRTRGMIETTPRPAAPEPRNAYLASLRERSAPPADASEISRMIEHCRRCPLWERATCAVPGEGPENARIMIVGEQPGDREDIEGRPFVGPAGKLLDEALREAGISRKECYVTNAVKHFKWIPKGKVRLHQKPSAGEVDACAPWLQAELSKIAPDILILLGATAARSLLGPGAKITADRGLVEAPQLASRVILTVHPSYLLRIHENLREEEMARFIGDLKLAAGGETGEISPT